MRAPKVNASEEIPLTARPSASTATQLVVSPAIPVGAPATAGSRPSSRRARASSASASRSRQASLSRGAALVPVPERPAGGLGQQVHRLRADRRQSGQEPVEEPGLLQQHPARRRRRRLVDGDVAVRRADRVLRRHVAGRAPTRRRRTARRRRAAARPPAPRRRRGRAPPAGGPAARCCRPAPPTTAGRRRRGRARSGSSHRARSASRGERVGVLGDVAAVLGRARHARRGPQPAAGRPELGEVAGAAQPVQGGQRADRARGRRPPAARSAERPVRPRSR